MTAAAFGGIPALLAWPVVVALAAVLGSFLNVCISRLPRRESIVSPPSHCPRCDVPIRYYDNIPLVSFALLRGRCRACQVPISWRYPLVEALAMGVGVLVLWQLGATWEGARAFVLGLILIAITFIDFETKEIPDRITLPGIAAGLALQTFPDPRGVIQGLHGCLLACGIFYVISWVSFKITGQEALGFGDVNLAGMLGAFLGWPLVIVAIFLGVFTGGLGGLALLLSGSKGRKDEVPFGPYLALGGFVTALWGRRLLTWYLG